MIIVLGVAWGALAVLPVRLVQRRTATALRARELRASPARTRRRRRARRVPRVVAVVFAVMRAPSRSRQRRRCADVFADEVAIAVDLVALGVAAGCTPYLAVDLAAKWGPPAVAHELTTVVRTWNAGLGFDDALREAGTREPGMRSLTDALRTTSTLGSPAGPALARLATELRADLRRRAEARARTVPVRLCFPLVGCILPAFALLTVVPVVLAGLHG